MAADPAAVRVTSVTLEGFKTYRQAHTVGPFSGFSVVVGSNGLGKSTVVEAIVWALGGAGALDGGEGQGRAGGRTPKKARDAAVISHGESRATVTVHLLMAGERLSIRRSVTVNAGAATAEAEGREAAAAAARVEVSVQRAGADGWSALSAVQLSALLATTGLGGAGGVALEDGQLPYYLSQGNSSRLLTLTPHVLAHSVELAISPHAVRATVACAAQASHAKAQVAGAKTALDTLRRSLEGAQPLLGEVRAVVRTRCSLLKRELGVLNAADALHRAWLAEILRAAQVRAAAARLAAAKRALAALERAEASQLEQAAHAERRKAERALALNSLQ
ncbi:hypothetical protein T492DRAFT_1152460, partial [Pavlovales sp. CCMP2436]